MSGLWVDALRDADAGYVLSPPQAQALAARVRQSVTRIEELEDVLRDILDITSGWSSPLSRRKRLSLIQDFAEVCLEWGMAANKSHPQGPPVNG